jgi:hypothetical protein
MKKKTQSEKPIAFRQVWQTPENLTHNAMYLPEFGGVAANVIFTDGEEITPRESIAPIEVGGITATFKVDVFATRQGSRKFHSETWFFSEAPKGQSPQEWIVEIHERETAQTMDTCQRKLASLPKPFYKTVKGDTLKQIDPWKNARQATLELLKDEFPEVARALGSKTIGGQEAHKAFVADCVRLFGSYDANTNYLGDSKFCEMIADAMQARQRRDVRKSKVDALDWYLANPKNWIELHALPLEEITRRANAATGFDLSKGAIEKRIERLKLVTARKRGPRTKS